MELGISVFMKIRLGIGERTPFGARIILTMTGIKDQAVVFHFFCTRDRMAVIALNPLGGNG